jgi:1-acyl-sn-glycerol-3-phosphate acyltransferase
MTRSASERFLAAAVRLLLRIFFREIEIVGLASLPQDRPLLIASNHGNALVDPMLIYGFLPVPSRFLAKSTLWRHPVAKYMVRLGRAIPVYRKEDIGADRSANLRSFERCREVLVLGGVIALFPEGTSHDEPALLPLKTGAARIALETEELCGTLGLRIVPVGLNFEAREQFRSRVLIQIGEPIDPTAEVTLEGADNAEAVRALTTRIDEGLRKVTLNYESWREAEIVECAAEVFSRPETDAPTRSPLARQVPLRRAFVTGYRELKEKQPDLVSSVMEMTDRYDRLLRRLGLEDRHVAAGYPVPLVLQFALRSLWHLTVWRPLSLIGLTLNWLPFKVIGWTTRALRLTTDQGATYKLLMSIVLYPIFWGLVSFLVSWKLGAALGAVTFLAAPVGGYCALVYAEQWRALKQETRVFLALKTRRLLAQELRNRRRTVYERVSHLVDLHQTGRTSS